MKQTSLFCGPGATFDVGMAGWDEYAKRVIDQSAETILKKKYKVHFNPEHLKTQLNGEYRNVLKILNECEPIIKKTKMLQLLSHHVSFSQIGEDDCKKIEYGSLHEELVQIPFLSLWTTNYDQLLEEAIKASGRTSIVIDRYCVAAKQKHVFCHEQPSGEMPVYKYHGTVKRVNSRNELPDVNHEVTLTGKEYARLLREKALLQGHLVEALKYNKFLFVGYSFPEQDKHITNCFLENINPEARHLALMTVDEFNESKARISDLNIDVCVVKDFNEILNIIIVASKYGAIFW